MAVLFSISFTERP